jgi:hypothetical protein
LGLPNPPIGGRQEQPGLFVSSHNGSKLGKSSHQFEALHVVYTVLVAVASVGPPWHNRSNGVRQLSVTASGFKMKCWCSRAGCGHPDFEFWFQMMAAAIATNVRLYDINVI